MAFPIIKGGISAALSLQPSTNGTNIGALLLTNLFMLIFGRTGIKILTKIMEMPRSIIIPLILLLFIVRADAVNNSTIDDYWMLGDGVFGLLVRVLDGVVTSPLGAKSRLFRKAAS